MPSPCICTNLRQAAQASTAYYDAALAPSGLRVTMFRLLRRIGEVPGISITDLAQVVDLDRSTLGRNLRVLERLQLVRVSTGQDERARAIRLTEDGEHALNVALPLWQDAQAQLGRELGADLDQLLKSLTRIAQLQGGNAHVG